MRGVRFYLEHESSAAKRRGEFTGNAVAVYVDLEDGQGNFDAVGAVFPHCNSAVASTGASREYLRRYCKRISEGEARRIHPRLFEYLDEED